MAARLGLGFMPRLGLWSSYCNALKTHPLQTRALTSGMVLGLADYTCQKMEGKEEINLRRMGSMAATGLVLVGPSLHYWYGFLGRVVGEASTVRVVATKLAMDQAFFAPLMFGSIMTSANLINGKPLDQSMDKLKSEFGTVMQRSWCVWPLATSINFGFVPPPYRVLFNNSVSFCWNTFLSYVNNRSADEANLDVNILPGVHLLNIANAQAAEKSPVTAAAASVSVPTVAAISPAEKQ